MSKKRYDDFLELVKARKQVYEFSAENVADKDIQLILEAASWAPSCRNDQPWRFIIVRNKPLIHRLYCEGTTHILFPFIPRLPPVLVVFVLDGACLRSTHHVCSEDPLQSVPDAYLCLAMCVQNAILEAKNLGVGSCILTPKRDAVSKMLKLNDPVPLMVGFGYESKNAFQKKRERKSLKALIMRRL